MAPGLPKGSRWAPKGRSLEPKWRQSEPKGALKTSQKNQYGDFYVSGSGPGSEKHRFWRVLENTWFLNGFLMLFGLILGPFVDDFSYFFHCLFETVFLKMFYSFLGRSLNWANPKNLDFSLGFIGYFALGTFHRRAIFRKISDKFQTIFALIFHQFS